ncbi:cysteine-rich receptor-like protein kinase 2 isoform X2 [Salvia splendens]|uniref:cysteine-rich receptor-like protein kinase 2 isoform X2 n=1 Tax=Salvia splendens TaxID=180675 RepID=UPI001C27776B|nr:cysteine-rich receptor-like protein kinase 2 isoform X2 [Salvia splendens]
MIMGSTRRLAWWLHLILAAAAISAAPQTNLITKGCSQYNASNESVFFNNLNATFSDLRSQLSGGRRFGTAEREESPDSIYCMAQCRSYMTVPDCLACYDFAVSQIRNCSTVGARLVYDGCFLRYESYNFYEQTIENTIMCGDRSALQEKAFTAAAQKLLTDLAIATPRASAYSTVSKREVSDDGLTIYAAAQCAETVTQSGCQGCLNAAYESINNCFPAAEARLADAACFLRYSDAPFFSDNQTTDITPLLDVGGKSSNGKVVVGGVVGGVGGLVILVGFVVWSASAKAACVVHLLSIFLIVSMGNKKQFVCVIVGNILGATELQRPNVYSYKELKAATDNFSDEKKLGEGSFGVVYKASLRNGNVVAVKRLDISYSRAKADFESEGRLISNVHHRNLVRLLGCCSNGSQLLLIYEYMENGSLDTFLYGEKRGSLSWKQRFDMIYGIARGIAYLHENYHVTIIHRDIKPSNILVDSEFEAKIADFGLARLLPENLSHVITKFAGTFTGIRGAWTFIRESRHLQLWSCSPRNHQWPKMQ